MKVLDPGHRYELQELGSEHTQTLTFIKRSGGSVVYEDEHPGLQTQEVLRALIDRNKYLYEILPCKETEEALKYLRYALYLYEVRAFRRKKEQANRTTNAHDDSLVQSSELPLYNDIPFGIEDIENRVIGLDGHIIV